MTDQNGQKSTVEPRPHLEGPELASEVLEIIEDNTHRWRQGSWRTDIGVDAGQYCTTPVTAIEAFADDPFNPACTTAFCYAGWIGAYDRVKWAKGDPQSIGDPTKCDCTTFCCTVGWHQMPISIYAGRRLGIQEWEWDVLFDGDNSLGVLRVGVQAIVDGDDVADAIHDYKGDNESEDY